MVHSETDSAESSASESTAFQVPNLPYEPPEPDRTERKIALVGCGNVTKTHLTAYRDAGWDVVAVCDLDRELARERRDEFYPEADVYTDAAAVLARDEITVVDIATPPGPRTTLIEDAIRADKHVLSQKPFVHDLDVGERLVELADDHGVRLAVNQNARWAPHHSYIREAVAAGLVGKPTSIVCERHWDHSGPVQGRYNNLDHAILYDYSIHWFDFLHTLTREREAVKVYATETCSPTQQASPPLIDQAVVTYSDGQATLLFDACAETGEVDRTHVSGTAGTITSTGIGLNDQTVTLHAEGGAVQPKLDGAWIPDGFRGTMGELLTAIDAGREPANSGRDNLRALRLCFAAIESAERGAPVDPATVTKLPE